MKPISEIPILRQYDKLIAVIVLIGLVISLFYLTSAGMNRKRDEVAWVERLEDLAPTGKHLGDADMSTYVEVAGMARQPLALTLPGPSAAGFLTPEHRVMCVEESCKKPIPYRSEICPFCGKKQPHTPDKPPPGMDSDGDGIPDTDEDRYGLNKNVDADAELDLDKDGFSNLDEHKNGTNPADPESHPPLLSLLRVKSIQSIKIPFIFTVLNEMPGGALQMTFNVAEPRRTFWVKEGEAIGDTGWLAVKVNKLFEKRKVDGMGDVQQTVEISTVVVKRKSDNKEVTLKINEGRKDTDVEATVVLPLDQTEYRVVVGGMVKVREEAYRVIAVDKDAVSVTVENESTGKTKIITKLD